MSPEAFRWTENTGMVGLGDLPGGEFHSQANAADADGSTIVGRGTSAAGDEAFRWTESTGMVGLGDLPGGEFHSQANSVSADGSIIVGRGTSAAGDEAFRWTESTGMAGLGDLPGGGFHSEANAISADGSTIVGKGTSPLSLAVPTGREAFRWTERTGMVGLGVLSSSIESSALDVSADGRYVVGYSTDTIDHQEPFIWDQDNGMRSLTDLLILQGETEVFNLKLISATGISASGHVIVGNAINAVGSSEAWLAILDDDILLGAAGEQPIPEPSTVLLMATGLVGLLGYARRRQAT